MKTRGVSLLAAGALLLMANDAHASRCQQLAQAGKRAEALDCFRAAVKKNPDDLESRNAVAALLAEQKKYQSALEEFGEVLERNPNDPVALNGKAMMLLALDRIEEGFAVLQKAIETDPTNVQALHNLALINFRHNHLDVAVPLWLQVLKVKPDDPDALVGLGEAKMKLGKLDDALGYFNKVIEKDDRHARAIWLAGKCIAQARPIAAIPYFERAALLGDDPEPWYDLGLARMFAGEWRLAGQALTQALKYAPEDPRIFLELGKVHMQMKRYDDAIMHLERVYELKPSRELQIATRYQMGLVREEQGNAIAAAAEYLQVLRMDPKHVASMLNLGVLYAEEKRYDEASKYLEKAVSIEPGNPMARLNLGRLLIEQGKVEEGKKELRTLLTLPEANPLRQQAEAMLAGRR